MGVSETILAAMIGAAATISTAIVQLLRARSANDPKPRRSRIRSYISIVALMLASGGAGFAYSELRALDIRGEIEALRRDFSGQSLPQSQSSGLRPIANAASLQGSASAIASVEALAHLPPCISAAADVTPTRTCTDAAAQRVALCVAVPEGARSGATQLYARGVDAAEPWVAVDTAAAATTIASAAGSSVTVRALGDSFRYTIRPGSEAVCIVVANWTAAHTQVARWVVELLTGDAA